MNNKIKIYYKKKKKKKEYNMRNILLQKSYRKCGGETIPKPFSKK